MSKSGGGEKPTGSHNGGPPIDSKEPPDQGSRTAAETESGTNSREAIDLALAKTQSDESKFAEKNQNATALGSGLTGFPSQSERRSNDTPSSDEKFSNAEENATTHIELNRCLTRGMTKGPDDSETLIRNIWALIYSVKDTDGPPPTYDAAIMSAFLRNVESVIASEPSVIASIKGTVCVVGDLHGQADSLISLISLAGFPSRDLTYVFLGNYT
ncbi:Ser/Thr protein phosphatase, partial [Aphelenchoides avenae]